MYNQQQYEKISDTVMIIGYNVVLKMNVNLYTYPDKYGRTSYHQEYEYYLQKAQQRVFSIKRNFDYYLSIENLRSYPGQEKDYIRISIQEMPLLIHTLNQVSRWIVDEQFENLFVYKDGKLIIMNRPDPIILDNLPLKKYIKFEPSIFESNEGTRYRTIRMYLNSETNFVEIFDTKFLGFKYAVENINLFESAQMMINYIQRPDLGTNLYDINNQFEEQEEINPIMKDGRKPASNKSYFDKIKELE